MGKQRCSDRNNRFRKRKNSIKAPLDMVIEVVSSLEKGKERNGSKTVASGERSVNFNNGYMADQYSMVIHMPTKPSAALFQDVALHQRTGIAIPNHTRGPRISMIVSETGLPFTLIGFRSESGFSNSARSLDFCLSVKRGSVIISAIIWSNISAQVSGSASRWCTCFAM